MKFIAPKNFPPLFAPLALGVCLALTGCQMFQAHNSNTDASFLWDYCLADPLIADRALTIYRNTYENRQDWSYKSNGYDDIYIVTDARQMEVNQVLNRPAEVEIYYQSATNNLTRAAINRGEQPKIWTQEDVKAIADKADAGLNVRWKK